MSLRLAALIVSTATAGHTLGLDFPSTARRTAAETEPYGSSRVAVTEWQPGGPQTIWAEGEIHREAWQMDAGGLTTLQILVPLRDQLASAGFEPVFECEAHTCGGFDFRYAADLLPEPAMHVNLGDFRYLAAQRMRADRADYVTLFVSRAGERGFVHLTTIGATEPSATAPPASGFGPLAATGDLAQALTQTGHAVLDDLQFETGSARLASGRFASLASLAEWLDANRGVDVVLVGHTDAEGGLPGNVALSRARAEAVRARLIDEHGVAADRVRAEGVGYLAPLDTNSTPGGRERNRRVEVVLADPL